MKTIVSKSILTKFAFCLLFTSHASAQLINDTRIENKNQLIIYKVYNWNGVFTPELIFDSGGPEPENDENQNAPWDMGREEGQSNGETGNDDYQLFYYHVKLVSRQGTTTFNTFDVKILKNSFLLEGHNTSKYDGLLIYLEGHPSSSKFTLIESNDAMTNIAEVERYASSSQLLSFYEDLQDQLFQYTKRQDWENSFQDGLDNLPNTSQSPCVTTIIEFLKKLDFHEDHSSAITLQEQIDQIYAKLKTFKNTCPQEL